MPAVRRLQHILHHTNPKPIAIVLRTRDSRLVLPAVFDPTLEFLVPGVRADAVDDADDELLGVVVEAGHQAVVHDVLLAEPEGVIPDAGLQEFAVVFADEEGGFEDGFDEVFVEKDFVGLACGLDFAVSHAAFQVEAAVGFVLVEEVLHD